MATVGISTLLYVLIGIVMTGMVDYRRLDVADPIAEAVRAAGPSLGWLEAAVSIAAVIGLAATVLVTFYGQTRIFMRMASDGMLPDRLGAIGRFRTPGTATLVCAIAGGLCAGFTPIDVLTNLVSIGTLLSFVIVSGAVLVLRRRRPDLERPFRVPLVNVVAPTGMVSAALLIALLPVTTWIRLAVWLLIGLVIFFAYAKPRSSERMARLAAGAASPVETRVAGRRGLTHRGGAGSASMSSSRASRSASAAQRAHSRSPAARAAKRPRAATGCAPP